MIRSQDRSSRFKLYLYLMLGIVSLFGLSLFFLVIEQLRYEAAVENRQQSIRLAAELRQSSHDLARLVRTYVITRDPIYKEQFEAVIDIRDGARPRPENYSLAYWDLKIADKDQSSTDNNAISLIDMIRQAGVVDKELEKLRVSKERSDALVIVEKNAIHLVEQSNSTPLENREQALLMLADDNFLSMKSDIMRPIIEAEQMISIRTQRQVEVANQRLIFFTGALVVLGGLLMILIFKLGQQLNLILGCPISELEKKIKELGKGNFLTPISLDSANAGSVLDWLGKTQRQLAKLNLSHFKAIIDYSDDAIISKDINGIIASWNRGAEIIFGYTEKEMIGKPMTIIIPLERFHEEADILKKIANGEKIDHFETQRLRKNGSLVDVSVTTSPIYNIDSEVIGASKIARDISRAKSAEAEIHRLAFFDSLTGLANRRLLLDRLDSIYSVALRENSSFAVVFLDLDNFKAINDSKGHDAGDALLREAARRLLGCVRESDTVSRFGGDEFVILLRGSGLKNTQDVEWVEVVVSNIIYELSQPYLFRDREHRCTTSVGVSVFFGNNVPAAELIRLADQAMYLAKASGKNCYKIIGID